MKELEERVLNDSKIIDNDIIKVASFLNHQIDVALIEKLAAHIKTHFNKPVTKVLTIEASGIAIGYAVARVYGNLPLVFAKKQSSKLTVDSVYTAKVHSFTKGNDYMATIDKSFLSKDDKVLIVDDFLAAGGASMGLVDLCKEAGAEVVGVAVAVEKNFQGGRKRLEQLGIKVYSGANILRFEDNKPIF